MRNAAGKVRRVRSERNAGPNRGTDFLQAGGDLGALIRAKDWSQTAVGAPETWSESLRTVVSLCLASNFPINIIWGAEHTQIYNDGYRDVCGEAHPRALGENYTVTWESAWPAIGEPFERARAGETSYLENQRMFLRRNGYLEETFFTFSLSPIRDESGGIGGLFHPVTETTPTMLAERRMRALRDLSTELARAEDESSFGVTAVEKLSHLEFDLPFLLYYSREAQSAAFRLVAHCGIDAGLGASPLQVDSDGERPWPLSPTLSNARILEVTGLASVLPAGSCGPYPEPPNRAFVIPIAVNGAVAVLVAGASSRLPLSEAYRTFYELLGATISSALATVRAREDDRRRVEALAEIDRAKTAFFANVSHEFRTPLTLMLGPLEGLLADPAALDHRAPLETVHRNGLRLLRLVNELLDFSRVEAGRAEANYEPAALADVTAEIASNFQSACDLANVALLIDCPPLSEAVYVDADMWETIVLNLISNAFKFTVSGTIAVTVRSDGRDAILTVQDTGMGIPDAELCRVFERFHRVESTHGRSHEGSGIGLALVKELVGLHQGSVDVASVLGQGTVFTVRLPLGDAHLPKERVNSGRVRRSKMHGAEAFVQEALRWLPSANDDDEAQSATPQDVASLPAQERARIVLVDDNSDMRNYVRHLLAAKYEVETAVDGVQALEMIERRVPDLVVSDVMMPRLDGFGLIQAIRERPALSNVRVILLSARAGEEARVEGLNVGADDYLVKPFSSHELIARVATNVHVSRLRRRADAALNSSERARRIAHTFQTASLPAALPNIPGMSFSCLYEPSSHEANVGGDFYDAFRLLDGRIVASIGDVAGAGLAAAATMAAVRQSIRAVAAVNPDPQMLLKAADDVFADNGRPPFASAFVAVIDPLTFSIRYASAGHPPPLLRSPDGHISALEGQDLLLGVTPEVEHAAREVHQIVADPGSLLVLYTDGITENTRDVLDGERRVTGAVAALDDEERTSDAVARIVCERTLGPEGRSHDDIAVLSVAFRERLTDCAREQVRRWDFDAADADAAHRVGDDVWAELERFHFRPEELFAAQMVFSELVGNVVRHAGTKVEVLLDCTQKSPVLHVLDRGVGFSLNTKLPVDAYEERGRGLFIVSRLVRDFSVALRGQSLGSHARAVLLGRIGTAGDCDR